MKSISEFKEAFLKDLPEHLPARMAGCEISTQPMSKNGRDVTGVILKMGSISPVFYIEHLYDEYSKGRDYDDLLDNIADTLDNMVPPQMDEVMDKLKNWKEGALIAAMPADSAKAQKFSHAKIIGDIAAVPYIVVTQDENSFGSVSYDDSLCEHLNIDPDELLEAAIKNTGKQFSVKTIRDVLYEMMPPSIRDTIPEPDDDEPTMLVISNDLRKFGAGSVFCNEAMDKVCEEYPALKNGCFILPSSIEEVIAVPFDIGDPGSLAGMVGGINGDVVEPQLVLSDNVYAYYPGVGIQPADPGRTI